MPGLWTHPIALRALNAFAMGKAFLRYRNPRRRVSGEHQTEFYEKTWAEAAKELGGRWTKLGPDMSQIDLAGVRTRVIHNVSEIDIRSRWRSFTTSR